MVSPDFPAQHALIKEIFGAYRAVIQQRFAIYVTNTDRNDRPVDLDSWVRRAAKLLNDLNEGATALPAAYGMWHGKEEQTVIVYSFVDPEVFFRNLPRVRKFLHRYGREANQGAVLFEFGSAAFFINDYDDPAKPNAALSQDD